VSGWLASAEHARAARFGRETLSRRYILGRALLRWVLGNALGLPPPAVPIVRGVRGRPQLANGAGIDFNVSHTRDVALIGLARTWRIGVDVERADRDVRADGLARKFLTSAEQATLAPLPESERRARWVPPGAAGRAHCRVPSAAARGRGCSGGRAPRGRIAPRVHAPRRRASRTPARLHRRSRPASPTTGRLRPSEMRARSGHRPDCRGEGNRLRSLAFFAFEIRTPLQPGHASMAKSVAEFPAHR
jgi:hypothetical protein